MIDEKIDVAKELDAIEQRIMSGLKDFQRYTVRRIDHLFRSGQMRILVSDEVGLGKTLIARGTIAKLAQMRKAGGDNLVKVVYICSNGAIAGQNLEKLMISNDVKKEKTAASRLSMQHLNIFLQENDRDLLRRYIQLIPLTPDTSFRMTAGTGTVGERALMFSILRRVPGLEQWLPQLEIALQDQAFKAWENEKNHYEDKVITCDIQSNGEYLRYMLRRVEQELHLPQKNGSCYFHGLLELCARIKENGNRRQSSNSILGKLRVMFARISLDKLEPDLVILDEFQRFRYLIQADPDTETGMLAAKFFRTDAVRMLLLSATPYKMYSTLEELDETLVDEHYREFMDVMSFLNISEEENRAFQTVWSDYSLQLRELSAGNCSILAAKQAAEDALYRHICRTERIAAVGSADLIDDHEVKEPLTITESDITAYVQAQKLLEGIGLPYNVPVDYIKSCPYILSFMRDYKLKKDIEDYFTAHGEKIDLLDRKELWLKKQSFDRYDPIAPGNARLARVMEHVFRNHAAQLLWVPPSKPYYAFGGAFQNAGHFSKTLIFSSWEMVPRMLAMLLSYEAERRTVGDLARSRPDRECRYFSSGEKRFPPARLNFSVSNDAPNAMTLFCLMYPSPFLADCYDPIDTMNRGLSLAEIEASIQEKLSQKLRHFIASETPFEDRRWYYLFPLVLDDPEYVHSWLNSDERLSAYEDDEDGRKQTGFLRHLQLLRELYGQTDEGKSLSLGKMPEDLLRVLSTMALASPAICAYRMYRHYTPDGTVPPHMPSQVAKVFMNRMNTPEATAVIAQCYGELDDAHWQNLLYYCKDGNLQAMFDEYGHLLTNGLDRDKKLPEQLHGSILESMNARTTAYSLDTLQNFKQRLASKNKERSLNIRTHFAVSFTKGIGEKDADRKRSVRNSFNSPFRPFVLASTSIGQEGLDFHNYCRRIVHWNLPANPIDLEQREGRINRFECLVLRQNIAERYGSLPFVKDIWKEMFEYAATEEKTAGSSDLIPFWGLKEKEGMVKIERIVPMYPFSRDETAYERLIKILSLYRLTLGQARQEELLEYLFQSNTDSEKLKELFINLSPFYKEHS